MAIDKKYDEKYITTEQLMIILASQNDLDEKIATIKEIRKHNEAIYQDELRKGKELENIAKIQAKELIVQEHKSPQISKCEKKDTIIEESKNDVSSYYQQLKNCKEEEDVLFTLEEIEEKSNIQDVLLKFYEEIVFLNKLRHDKDVSYDDEDIIYMDQEIDEIKNKFSVIKEYINTRENTTEDVTCVEKPVITYLKTKTGKPCVLSDVKDIPREYYDNFYELFNSILEGKFKNHKFLIDNRSFVDGLQEVKGFKTRILYKNISDNNYVILGMFIKKSDNDKNVHDFIKKRSSLYQQQERRLLKSFMDPDQIIEAEETTKILSEIFGSNKKEEGKTYGKVDK